MEIIGTIFNMGMVNGELPRIDHVLSSTVDSSAYFNRGTFCRRLNYCFQYTLSGSGILRHGSKLFTLKEGTAFFSRISDPALEYYFPRDGKEPWKFFYCKMEGKTLYTIAEELCRKFGHFYTIPQDLAIIRELTELSQKELHLTTPHSKDNLQLTMNLLTAISLYGEEETVTPEDTLIDQALKYIQCNIEKPINASEVSQALGISREHLSRLFQKRLGLSPYKVIIEQKIKLVTTYLKESTLPIKEVAAHVGILPHNFSYWFRKNTGMSPKEFRLKE